MELAEYKKCLEQIPYGKRLPTALYVLWEPGRSFGNGLDALLQRLKAAFGVSDEFNVLKFRTDELKISFLSYPDFWIFLMQIKNPWGILFNLCADDNAPTHFFERRVRRTLIMGEFYHSGH
jgi:hypothetical protein